MDALLDHLRRSAAVLIEEEDDLAAVRHAAEIARAKRRDCRETCRLVQRQSVLDAFGRDDHRRASKDRSEAAMAVGVLETVDDVETARCIERCLLGAVQEQHLHRRDNAAGRHLRGEESAIVGMASFPGAFDVAQIVGPFLQIDAASREVVRRVRPARSVSARFHIASIFVA